MMEDFLFRGNLAKLDPTIYKLTQLEAERQYRKLILIPSESQAPMAVREALSSAFQNVYAEGYPREETRSMTVASKISWSRSARHSSSSRTHRTEWPCSRRKSWTFPLDWQTSGAMRTSDITKALNTLILSRSLQGTGVQSCSPMRPSRLRISM